MVNETINVLPIGNVPSICIKFHPAHTIINMTIHLKPGSNFNKNCKYQLLNGQYSTKTLTKKDDVIFGNVVVQNSTRNNVTVLLVGCEWLYGSVTVKGILNSLSLMEYSPKSIYLLPRLNGVTVSDDFETKQSTTSMNKNWDDSKDGRNLGKNIFITLIFFLFVFFLLVKETISIFAIIFSIL